MADHPLKTPLSQYPLSSGTAQGIYRPLLGPCEISQHVYFFIRSEGGVVKGHALSTTYRPSTIPSGGLEIPLLLMFSCSRFLTFQKMKEFVTTLYNYYSGNTFANMSNDDEDDEDDIEFDITQMVEVHEEDDEDVDDDDVDDYDNGP